MKHVYWQVKKKEVGYWLVEYWTKPDKSNAITTRMVTLEETKLRYNIKITTGLEEFTMEQVKVKGQR